MKYKNKAVVLGTNYYIGLGVVRALGMQGIYVVSVDHDKKSHYGVSKYVKEALIGPHYKKEEKKLVEFLIDYAKKEEYKPVLFPTADLYVEFMENNYDELKKYFLWPNDKKGLYKKIMDKRTLVEFTEKYSIKTPEILDIDDEDLLEKVDKDFGYPCLLKPRDSMNFVNTFRQKAFKVFNRGQLEEQIKKVKEKNFRCFVQRIIKGPDSNCYSFDVYMKDKEAKAFMTTSKIRQWPINFGASTYAKQVYIEELYDLCMPLFKGEDFQGFAEVELKRDEKTGDIYLIEINVRFVNFVWLQHEMGMNTPLYYYLHSIGEDFQGPKIKENKEVYWKYQYEDFSAIKAYLKSGQMTLKDIIKDYRFKKVSSTWNIKDPMPGIKFFLWAIGHKIFR